MIQVLLVIMFLASSVGALWVQYWIMKVAVRNGMREALADSYLRSAPAALAGAGPASVRPVPANDTYGLLADLEAAERKKS